MRIKELREDIDLTQTDIAKIIDWEHNTYARYEGGEKQIPIAAINRLCIYYNVSSDYIFDLPDLPFPKR